MILHDPQAVSRVRCEPCVRCAELRQQQTWRTEVHHIYPRGAGGGFHCDLPENLLPLCSTCHNDVHADGCHVDWCWRVSGERHGMTGEAAKTKVLRFLFPNR